MRKRIRLQLRRLRPAIRRMQASASWFSSVAIRALKWFNELDLPLSPLQWILLFYVIFGISYALATPVFEANDELWHFGYVQYLRETGNLPLQVFDGGETVYAQHGSQPPLYYALTALLTLPFDIDDVDEYRWLNPHVSANQPDSFGNKNLIMHDDSNSMWHGTGLVVMLIRFAGLAMGLGTVVLVYKIGEYVAPQRATVAFVAAAFTGLNPMFVFVSVSVNNDSLAMILNAALVLLLLRSLRYGFNLKYSLAIGLLFALTSITKLTSLVLLPVLLLASAFVYYRERNRKRLFIYLFSLVLFWLLLAAWWYVRNMLKYSEPFGMITMANIAGPRGMTFNLVNLFGDFQHFRMSYWGMFGVQNIQVTAMFYLLLDLMTFFSVIGCLFLILQLLAISDFAYARYELSHLLTLLFAFVLLWGGVFYWSTLTRTSEGRILFPLIGVISPVLAVGFVEIVWWIVFSLRPPNLEFVRAGDAVPKELLQETMLWQLRILGVVALLAPFTVIASQYSAPKPVDALPQNARQVYAEFGDVALIAYERIDRRYSPGDKIRVNLYWKVLAQSALDNSVMLSLVDDKNQQIGHYSTYPGAGTLRTSRWIEGAIYPDEYIISIHVGASGRYPFDLRVEWQDTVTGAEIEATSAKGEPIEPVLLDIGAVVSARLQTTSTGHIEIPVDLQPNFDESILLQSFLLDPKLNELILSWKAEATPLEDYTVFVHVVDDDGNIIVQADVAPRLPTRYWRWGENYSTYHQFPQDLTLLDHTVLVGWYLNDGLSYPKTEYRRETEEGEEFLTAYVLPWDIYREAIQLTAEAAAAETSETLVAPSNIIPDTAAFALTVEPAPAAATSSEQYQD